MWSSDSLRWRAASTASSRRSLTLPCPVKSAKTLGRSDRSSVLSWIVSVMNRSGMNARCKNPLARRKTKPHPRRWGLEGGGGFFVGGGGAQLFLEGGDQRGGADRFGDDPRAAAVQFARHAVFV